MTKKILWNEAEIQQALSCKLDRLVSITGVSIDSRTVQPGDMFVAIKGEQVDGHAYVAKSLEKGAILAIVSEIPKDVKDSASLIVVKDTLKALEQLARFRRNQTQAKVIGVTGSVGKTSTKGMMAHALAACGPTHSTTGNFNNHIGLPLTLARMPRDVAYAVIEMGMNHAGEIAPLANLTRPHVAIVTTVESVHLEYFEKEEDIAFEKTQIFSAMEKNGVAVLNADNRHTKAMSEWVNGFGIKEIHLFGESEQADTRLLSYTENEQHQAEIKAKLGKKNVTFILGITGKHQAVNALGVLTCIEAVGAPIEAAMQALQTYLGATGRGQVLSIALPQGGQCHIMDDSYNASPASVKAGISTLSSYAKRLGAKRTIAVLGDMFELGPTGPSLHESLADNIVTNKIDLVFTAGGLMHNLFQKLPRNVQAGHYKDSVEAASAVIGAVKSGDVLLVKGSHGMRMDKIVDAFKELDKERRNAV
jgi:UDP-N-acetylmuramoyl-tripeptide--D-alanyl-D-alanine ligase